MTRCALHKAEMEVHHFKIRDVALCPQGCSEQGPPGSFLDSGGHSEKARRPCGLEACNRLLPRFTGGRPRDYCSPKHRDRAAYLRRKSEPITEALQR